MRLSARYIQPEVMVSPEAKWPIRLRTGGLVFTMDAAEALDLATQLADAVAEINNHEGNTPS